VKRENWLPNDSTWICSRHFVTGKKSKTLPSHKLKAPLRRNWKKDVVKFERRQATKRRRLQTTKRRRTKRRLQSVIEETEGNEESSLSQDSAMDSADQCVKVGGTAGSTKAAGVDNEECPKS